MNSPNPFVQNGPGDKFQGPHLLQENMLHFIARWKKRVTQKIGWTVSLIWIKVALIQFFSHMNCVNVENNSIFFFFFYQLMSFSQLQYSFREKFPWIASKKRILLFPCKSKWTYHCWPGCAWEKGHPQG